MLITYLRGSIIICLFVFINSIHAQDTLAFWGMNEGSGNVSKEKISNNNFACKTKWTYSEWVPGIRKTAIRTDGYTAYLEGNISGSFPTDAFSVTAWIAPDTYPVNTAAIWSNTDPVSEMGASVAMDRFGRLTINFTVGTQVIRFNSTVSPDHAKWNFIVVNIDAVNGQANGFINGVNVMATSFTPGSLTWPTTKTYLGRSSSIQLQDNLFPTNYFNGIIDEVIVRNRLLTGQEITQEYNQLKPAFPPDMSIPSTRFTGDFHRPKYHAVPKAGWGNESHGLVYYNGLYHMFYQKQGNGPYFGFQNWGHFTSPDLINWKETEVAIWPNPGWESVGNWSGHLVVDNSNIAHIIYTGVDGVKAAIGEATSTGDLLHWNKNNSNPLIPNSPVAWPNNDFRDPYVFREGNTWYMLVGSGLKSPQTGTVFLYKSSDLNAWQLIAPLFIDQSYLNDPGLFWEMPVFWKFGDKYMLLVNKTPSGGSPAKAFYWVGNFVNETFVPTDPHSKNLEVINHLLSPCVNRDAQDNPVAIGIIPDLLPGSEQYNHGWAHVFGLPRTWQMVNDTLYQKPHPNLESLRTNPTNYSNVSISTAGSNYFNRQGWQLEIKATIQPGTAKQVGFILDKNISNSEYTRIYYDYQNFNMVVDHSKSSTNPNTPKNIQSEFFYLAPGQPVEWDIFIDGSVIDVFINNKWAFATRAFPANGNSNIVDLFANGGTALLTSGTIWQINPAVLPVKWDAFTATKNQGNSVELNWKVSNEIDNRFFVVEKSGDGKMFRDVARVLSKGNGANHYTWTDPQPVPGINYYRIRQVDIDGNYTYSIVKSIAMNAASANSIFFLQQNPVQECIEINFTKTARQVSVLLCDAMGRNYYRGSYPDVLVNGKLSLPVQNLVAGIYSLVIGDGVTMQSQKILIQ